MASEPAEDGRIIVTLYVTNVKAVRKTCDDCRRIRALMDALNVKYETLDVDSKEMRELVVGMANGSSVLPQCFVGASCIGDYDCLMELNEDGLLPTRLREAGYTETVRGGEGIVAKPPPPKIVKKIVIKKVVKKKRKSESDDNEEPGSPTTPTDAQASSPVGDEKEGAPQGEGSGYGAVDEEEAPGDADAAPPPPPPANDDDDAPPPPPPANDDDAAPADDDGDAPPPPPADDDDDAPPPPPPADDDDDAPPPPPPADEDDDAPPPPPPED